MIEIDIDFVGQCIVPLVDKVVSLFQQPHPFQIRGKAFGTDPDPHTQTPVNRTTNNYDPGPLSPSTTYYWAVDELDSGGGLLAAGAAWCFTTAPAPGQASTPNPGDATTAVEITLFDVIYNTSKMDLISKVKNH